jgi:periplasmic protein TonB
MPEPLSFPTLISRPRDVRRLGARAAAIAVAAAWFAGFTGGLVLLEILWAESSLPPHAVTMPIDFHRSPPSIRTSLPGGGGGPKSAVPPAPQPAPVRPAVVPLPPPLSDDQLPPEPPPENPTDIGAADGIGIEGIPGGADIGGDCIGCTGLGHGGPGDGDGKGPGSGPGSDYFPETTPGLEPPVVIPSTRVHPDYPEIARKAKVGGSVLLLIVIDQDGRVGSIEVLASPDARFGFDLAAIEAVKRWRYRPARLGGRPVSVQASVRVEFTLAR